LLANTSISGKIKYESNHPRISYTEHLSNGGR